MNHKKKIIIVAVFLIIIIICSTYICLNLNKIRTIMSLKKVDDYPLYYMRYYGDYHLDYSVSEGNHELSSSVETSNSPIMCSGFFAKNEDGDFLFCRNLDYALLDHIITVLFTNAPDKNASISMADLFYLGYNDDNPPSKSLFEDGLLYSPRVTIDGVNEYGLALASLSVPFAKPPYDKDKPATDEVGIMRLVLDHTKTVTEAVEKINEYNIIFREGPVHFMIADSSGDSAVIEFIDGQIIVYRDNTDWQVCTNFVLSQDLGAKNGLDRYNIAIERLEENNGVLAEADAMQLLSDISVDGTVWSVIYNLRTGEANIVMDRNYEKWNHYDINMINE